MQDKKETNSTMAVHSDEDCEVIFANGGVNRLYLCPPSESSNLTGGVSSSHYDSCNQSDEKEGGIIEKKPSEADISSDSYRSRPAFAEHLGKHRQYWRDIILGVNDGLVSTFLLVTGVAGGGMPTKDILLTSIAGAIAGAISMCAGEFVATKSQDEVLRGEIELESSHIRDYRFDELEELADLLPLIGIPEDDSDEEEKEEEGGVGNGLRRRLLEYYKSDPDALLKIMVALEFGVLEQERRSPWLAGITSCGLFFLGSLPSVLPFTYFETPQSGLAAAAILTGLSLLLVGAIKSWATRGEWTTAAIENLLIAGVGGAIAYGVGILFGKSVI